MTRAVLTLACLLVATPAVAQSIKSTSEIGTFEKGKWTKTDRLPPALHGSGEALRDAYVAPDGTQFLVGYMYTGVPGPDTGVVYRKDRGGTWKMVYSKRENELSNLWGTSSSDVYASGVKTLAHWDGTAWTELDLPKFQGGVAGGWTDGKQLLVATADWSGKKSKIHRRDEKGTWTEDGVVDAVLFGVGGTATALYAHGTDGAIFHRTKAGAWTDESVKEVGQVTDIYAASATDIYTAGSRLMHSTGDGKWTEIKLPKKSQVINVWGLSSKDVYAGTLGGLFHWDGKRGSATAWTHDTEAIAGNATTLLVANQHLGD